MTTGQQSGATNMDLPIHWRFAEGQAFAALRELIRSFDFERLVGGVGGHTYAGIEPRYLLDVIDGFLSEPNDVVFAGDRASLEQLRQLLVKQIQMAYEQGRNAGRIQWRVEKSCGPLSTAKLHQRALQLAPADEMLRGWFAEGFCRAYSSEELGALERESTS